MGIIFAIKFVHEVLAAVMFGGWLAMALFMLHAHRSANTSVVALTARFVVRLEKNMMIAAMALQPVFGFAAAGVIGVPPFGEFWIVLALGFFGFAAAAWLLVFWLEIRIRDIARDAALESRPLPERYRRLFRLYSALVWPGLAAMLVIFALMVFQPRAQ